MKKTLLKILMNLSRFKLRTFLIVVLFISQNYISFGQQTNLVSPLVITEKVIPNVYASTAGPNTFLGPFSNSPRTYQLLVSASELTDLIGKNLISISFRNTTTATTAWPTTETIYTNYDIYLSDCVNPANRSFTFANNAVGVQTQVRTGSLTIAANALTIGNNPNNFSFDVSFSTPYAYSGGNLLIEIRHNGSNGTPRSVDSIGTATSGYGTLVSACWSGNYTATTTTTQGNFAIVNLKADANLANSNFEYDKVTIYPNPVTDFLNISSESTIQKITIFNLLGQKMLDKTVNSFTTTIYFSDLDKGNYVIQLETENGKSFQKLIKN